MSNPKQTDKFYLITVSDKQGTKHFRVPKLLKTLVLSASAVIAVVLIASNVMVFTQQGKLNETQTLTNKLEDTFVKLTTRNSDLNKSLDLSKNELAIMSEVITQMEQISGTNSEEDVNLLSRLTVLSEHFTAKELDFVELDDRVELLEESIGLDSSSTEEVPLESRIELASLDISQQKILHDSIPNGYPTRGIGVTSKFGKRIHPTTKQASFHNGIDLKAVMDTNIYATADGLIKEAGYNKLSGKRIIVVHNFGFETRYAHLSEMMVKVGDVVQKGDLIGLTGKSGRVDGPHLHYEVRHLNKPYNPKDFIDWEFGDKQIFTNVRGIQWHSLISLINKQISRPTLQLSQVALKSKAQ